MSKGSAEGQYTLWMIDMYGEDFVRQMHKDKRKLKKIYKKDYEDMLQHFNELIKYHEERLSWPQVDMQKKWCWLGDKYEYILKVLFLRLIVPP